MKLTFDWFGTIATHSTYVLSVFFLLFTTRLDQRGCHGVSLSVSLPKVHSVSLCGKTTKIQAKLKRSKVTPNPPALSLTGLPLSQEHHGKSLYGTDKYITTKVAKINLLLKTFDQAHPTIVY